MGRWLAPKIVRLLRCHQGHECYFVAFASGPEDSIPEFQPEPIDVEYSVEIDWRLKPLAWTLQRNEVSLSPQRVAHYRVTHGVNEVVVTVGDFVDSRAVAVASSSRSRVAAPAIACLPSAHVVAPARFVVLVGVGSRLVWNPKPGLVA